jgi:alkylresorcinol/alkylpyrone synthase
VIHLQHLATVSGQHTYSQSALADALHAELSTVDGAEKVAQLVRFVYQHSTISERHLEVPLEECRVRGDWYALVNHATLTLAGRALDRLFAGGRAAPASACDGLVVVSSSFGGFPGLTRLLQEKHGFPLHALCFDLGALGCAGPTQGLALASMLLAQGACRNVCVVCADAMGTHGAARHHGRPPTMAQVVAHCLASDGAAALVVGRDPGARPPLSFRGAQLVNRLWPRSLDLNDFTADEDNQPLMSVGKDIRERVIQELEPLLDGDPLGEPILFHPGGAALMKLIAERWPVLADTIALSSRVLERHGNLGSSSVLWVLAEALASGATLLPRLRLAALGPGIVSTVLLLDGVER